MSNNFLRFGIHEVLLLRDGVFEASADVLTHAQGEIERVRTIKAWGSAEIRLDVNCFVLKCADGITLIDAGAGDSWGSKFGQARTAIREAGIAREEVQRILLTHIHGDHVLGLFDGMNPYFPHAEVLVPDEDLAFFTNPSAWKATPEARRGGFDMAERLLQVYGPSVRRMTEGTISPGLEARPLPGHTPGHTGYLVDGTGRGDLLIWGDTLHLGEFQSYDPEIGMVYDLDVAMAARTRRATLDSAVREHWTIAGGHLSGFYRVRRADSGVGYQIYALQ